MKAPLRGRILAAVLLAATMQLALAEDRVRPMAAPEVTQAMSDAEFDAWLTAERQAVEQRRTAAQAQFQASEMVCWHRFAVNDCLHEARVQRREVLDRARDRQLRLNTRERDRRTAKRLRAIEGKSQEEGGSDTVR